MQIAGSGSPSGAIDFDATRFRDWIHEAFVLAPSQWATTKPEDYSMSSISSIPASTPVSPPDTSQSRGSDAQASSADDDAYAAAAQPPAQSPLPPGQGTRIDQLV